jgi:nicotinamide-nucleotide amidase
MSEFQSRAETLAVQLADLLKSRKESSADIARIVFAESCTCGMIAAVLGQVSGISEFLCGSIVTYRESSKTNWIGVSETTLAKHTAESIETTIEMAEGVLQKTPEATIAAAITGHFGPGAPEHVDGQIHIAILRRNALEKISSLRVDQQPAIICKTLTLSSQDRQSRQLESVCCVLEQVMEQVVNSLKHDPPKT